MIETKALALTAETRSLPLAAPFRISGHVFTTAEVVVVSLSDGTHTGRGEASGVYYLGDDAPAMLAAIEAARERIELGATRDQLRTLMPAGGGRNAVDAALWELEARRTGLPIWALAGLPDAPRPIVTTFTLGADEPEVMAARLLAFPDPKAIKIKLTGELELDIARVRAVRAAKPECWIGVDANQGYGIDQLDALSDALVEAGISLLEQPLERGRERDLQGYHRRLPFAADESVLTLEDIPSLVGLFDVVNIKLDKCGGLTEGLEMARAARALGMQVMVGNMVGTSLAMAPAFVLGQLCDVVDLDGPIFLAEDITPGIVYESGTAWCSDAIWGREG